MTSSRCCKAKGEAPLLSLVSLGCAKNAVDLQVRASGLLARGWRLSPDPDRADTVIVNTCAFIASAREEAESEIRRALALKAKGNYSRVVVAGCYPQRYPEAAAAFPGVDEWLGVPSGWAESALPGMRLTGKAFAYLKIAEGCSHRCAYCAIPAIRGPFRSRPMRSIVREARALVSSGCRELNVIAQDPMLWREGDLRLPDLLRRIDRIPGDFWVRVLYSYPDEITEGFLEWMLTSPHAVRYIDVPIQHTVPEVLARMNRRRAIAASRAAADSLRAAVPGVTLRTTVMTGFPGETEARFRELMSDLRRMQFDRLGAFAYSPEAGTDGAAMRGRPSAATARERERLVMRQQAAIWRTKAKDLVGGVFRALVVAPGVARLESQAPDVDGVVYLDGSAAGTPVGEFADVRLVRVRGFDFSAVAAEV
ncbi:MAG: radical SAM protein [Kiritimatiellae bacterium]|nr:radical SAM protein [Kiritimatiellia bacterium]